MITQKHPSFVEKIVNLKKKIFGSQLVLNYYSNTYDIVNARLYFFYNAKHKQNAVLRKNFKIIRGNHNLEFDIPVRFKQLNSIQIDILDYESNDDRYLYRINDLYFANKQEKST